MPDQMTAPEPNTDVLAEHVAQYAHSWNGETGGGVPFKQVTVNDDGNPAGDFRNLGAGGALRARTSSGKVAALAGEQGFRYSPDGVTENLTPKASSGDNLPLVLTRRLTEGYGGTITPSAGVLSLNDNGNVFAIGGSAVTITSIVAAGGAAAIAASMPITLLFATAGFILMPSSTFKLHGPFLSSAVASLTLVWDGSAWWERARSGCSPIVCSLYKSGAQSVGPSASAEIAWDAELSDLFGMHSGSATAVIPPVAGLYLCRAGAQLANNNSGVRGLWFRRNSSAYDPGQNVAAANNGEDTHLQIADEITFNGSTDTLEVTVNVVGGASLALQTGQNKTFLSLRLLGPA